MATLSVRFDSEKMVLLEEARKRDGSPNLSTWAREKLIEAAVPGTPVQPHPQRALALQRGRTLEAETTGCQHPLPARQKLPFKEICGVCGEVVRRL